MVYRTTDLELLGEVDAGHLLAELSQFYKVAVGTLHWWMAKYSKMTREETAQLRLSEKKHC